MKRFSTLFAIGASLAIPSLASAEPLDSPGAVVLTGVTGMVLVNHGGGYTPVKRDQGVKTGDRIMARAGGRANLLYGNGCSVSIQPGKVLTVGATPNCEHYSAGDKLYTAADLPEPRPAPPAFAPTPVSDGIGTWPIIVGGLVVVGAGVGIAVATQSSNSPASP